MDSKFEYVICQPINQLQHASKLTYFSRRNFSPYIVQKLPLPIFVILLYIAIHVGR